MKLTESNSVNLAKPLAESAVAPGEYEATGLLPCPFCDDAAIYGKTDDGGRFVTCVNLGCLASTNVRYACGDDPLPILAEQWNRRAGMQPPNNQQNSDHVAVIGAKTDSVHLADGKLDGAVASHEGGAGWVSIKDRAPEYDQPVLIAWDCTPWSKEPEVFNELYAISWQGDCWLWYDFESGDLCEWGAEDCPTHWMPKPLPPVAAKVVETHPHLAKDIQAEFGISKQSIAEAVTYWNSKWPAELSSGVMFFKGHRITKEEFISGISSTDRRPNEQNDVVQEGKQ